MNSHPGEKKTKNNNKKTTAKDAHPQDGFRVEAPPSRFDPGTDRRAKPNHHMIDGKRMSDRRDTGGVGGKKQNKKKNSVINSIENVPSLEQRSLGQRSAARRRKKGGGGERKEEKKSSRTAQEDDYTA